MSLAPNSDELGFFILGLITGGVAVFLVFVLLGLI